MQGGGKAAAPGGRPRAFGLGVFFTTLNPKLSWASLPTTFFGLHCLSTSHTDTEQIGMHIETLHMGRYAPKYSVMTGGGGHVDAPG